MGLYSAPFLPGARRAAAESVCFSHILPEKAHNRRTKLITEVFPCILVLSAGPPRRCCAHYLFFPSGPANTGTGVPVAENLELTTYRETSVGGRMAAVDPDGESVRFLVTTQPSKGTLEASEDGRFVYTPSEGKRGRDYFGYKAVDASGNLSQEATVILHIKKRPACVEYADTAGLPWDYAACVLASEGVFTGSCVAGHYLFEPDRTVSQGEFLTLCMDRPPEWHSPVKRRIPHRRQRACPAGCNPT